MIRKILIRTGVFILIFFGINFLFHIFLCEEDVRRYNPIVYRCSNINEKYDLVYLGESSNITTADKDSSRKKISDFVKYFRPDLNILTIDTFAVHAGIFKAWVKSMKVLPKAFVITMNLRSFNSAWINSTLETPLQKSVRMKQTIFCGLNRFLMSIHGFNDKSLTEREIDMRKGLKKQQFSIPGFRFTNAAEWDKEMAKPLYSAGFSDEADSLRIVLACHYIKSYAFTIDEQNPRIKDFDDIVDFCERNNVKIYFNLLPENLHFADSLAGKELPVLMRKNRDYLVQRYNVNNNVVIDQLEELNASHFIDLNWTTEHYYDRGRIIIAKNIADNLK